MIRDLEKLAVASHWTGLTSVRGSGKEVLEISSDATLFEIMIKDLESLAVAMP